MIKILDKSRKLLAILENAYDAEVERKANELWLCAFSLPADDPKKEYCQHFNYVEVTGDSGRYYGLYRIMPKETKKDDGGETIRFECEHVLATLLDDVMLSYHQYTNYTTTDVLRFILNQQTTTNWVLGNVEFTRYFHYSFENENGLLAPILSIPQPFDEPYLFTFDTTSYPWTLNLVRPSDVPQWEIRWGKDMIDFEELADPSEIVNIIYPLGYGEGVNQLTINEANGGLNHLKNVDSINTWGKHHYVWIDRRFEDAETLKASAQSLLNQWKDPKISFDINAADLSLLPEYAHEQRPFYTVGNIIVEDTIYQARIIGDKIPLDREYDVEYSINNKLDDIATTQADVERKQRVNEAYSQGATNIDSHDYQDNADPNNPAVIRFYLPDDLVNVNTLELTYETDNFRAYSQATEGGGATTVTSEGGGGKTVTSGGGGGTTTSSGSGGGVNKSTDSGGSTTQTSSANGSHRHMLFKYTGLGGSSNTRGYHAYTPSQGSAIPVSIDTDATSDIYTYDAADNHSHGVTIPSHSHEFNTPNHSHTITLNNHTHSITLDPHTHDTKLPDHTHEVKHGIYKLSETPTSVEIRVDGNLLPNTSTSGDMIDLIPYLSVDGGGKIQRGTWHEIEITPNTLARINANIISRLFIQSRLGGTH